MPQLFLRYYIACQPCPNYAPTMPQLCPNYAPTMPQLCPKYAFCPNYARVLPQLCPNYVSADYRLARKSCQLYSDSQECKAADYEDRKHTICVHSANPRCIFRFFKNAQKVRRFCYCLQEARLRIIA